MKLSGSQLESLQAALLNAFAGDELRRMVRIKLDTKLDEIVSSTNLSNTVFELIEWADRHGKLDELITGAAQTNPGNRALKAWIQANAAESTGDGLESTRSVSPPEQAPPPGVDTLKDRFASFAAKTELVNALLACPTVRNSDKRNSIVDNLPDNIRDRIERSNTDQIDVINIVNRTLDFSDGLTDFLDRVRFYEGDSDPMKHVDKLVG